MFHDFVSYRIQRSRGDFGIVRVHWQIVYNGTSNPVPEGTQFEAAAGSTEFTERQEQQQIQITSRIDGIPEFEEFFDLVLVNVTGECQYKGQGHVNFNQIFGIVISCTMFEMTSSCEESVLLVYFCVP